MQAGGVLMIIPSGNGCGSTVAIMQKVSPKRAAATAPECYGIKVGHKQSGATSMTLFRWRTDAWAAVGRTQKQKKWKW